MRISVAGLAVTVSLLVASGAGAVPRTAPDPTTRDADGEVTSRRELHLAADVNRTIRLRAGTARRVRVSVVATDGAGNSAVVRRAVRLPATMGRHDLR